MMESTWGRWLVSHRFMRALYGTAKSVTFPALALVQALRVAGAGSPYAGFLEPLTAIASILVLVTVATNLLRGIPVLIESRRLFVRQHLESPR
jgi:hypothetical protein